MTRRWRVPVNVHELRRYVTVEAASKGEAAEKARNGDWIATSEPSGFTVTVIGMVHEITRKTDAEDE